MKVWAVTLGGVTYPARPVSAEAVLRHITAPSFDGLLRLLRMAYPLTWRTIWHGDPARKILRSGQVEGALTQLLEMPKAEPPAVRVPDAWDQLEAAMRDPVPPEPGPIVTLGTVCRLVEATMGAGWYYSPDRWDTVDGFAPLDQVHRAWETMRMTRAWDRLTIIRAVSITKAGDKAQPLYDSDVREALGG